MAGATMPLQQRRSTAKGNVSYAMTLL